MTRLWKHLQLEEGNPSMSTGKNSKVTETTQTQPIFEANLEDDFFGDIDQAFAQIQMDTPQTSTKVAVPKKRKKTTSTTGITQLRDTYTELVNLNLSPIVRYIKAYEFGVDTTDLTQIMEYIVSPMIVEAKNVGLKAETTILEDFVKVLRKINRTGGKITQPQMDDLLEVFERVETTFRLDYRGHSTAVVNLVFFYRSMKRKNTLTTKDLKSLFSIGIPSMTMLRKISLAELVSLTGLPQEKATWIRTQARTFTLFDFV